MRTVGLSAHTGVDRPAHRRGWLLAIGVVVALLAAHGAAACCQEPDPQAARTFTVTGPSSVDGGSVPEAAVSDEPCDEGTFLQRAAVLNSDAAAAEHPGSVLGLVPATGAAHHSGVRRRVAVPRAPPSHARRLASLCVLRT